MEINTQQVRGNSTVVEGDTVVFQRVRRENAPCHFFKESCDLPPIPVEGGNGAIHLPKGYFLVPSGGNIPMRGEVNRNGNEVDIRIWPDFEAAGVSPSITEPVIYEAWVRDLAPGTYKVRVVHEHDALRVIRDLNEEGTPAVVADTTVEVE